VDRIFYGEPRPYQVSLSDVKVILAIMRILMVELLCQMVMRQILVLECMLSVLEYVLSCLALNGLAISGPQLSGHLPGT
jgi:hypothetical protein